VNLSVKDGYPVLLAVRSTYPESTDIAVTVYVLPDSEPVTPLDGLAATVQFAESSAEPTKIDMVVAQPV
jgi:hypothetical protein